MISVDPSVPVVQLLQALSHSGLGVREVNGELRIVQTASYQEWGYTATGHVPSFCRFLPKSNLVDSE